MTKPKWWPTMLIAQLLTLGASPAPSSFDLPLGNVSVQVKNLPLSQVDTACLSGSLRQVLELYNSQKLDQIRTELTPEHEKVRALSSLGHAVIPIGDGKISLIVTIRDDGALVAPFVRGESSKLAPLGSWYSASGRNTGLLRCLK